MFRQNFRRRGYYSIYPMLLFLLGGSIALAAGLLATASYTEGTLVAFKTTAQVMGWLFVGAILLALFAQRGLRRASFGEVSAAAVTFISGIAVLYIAYFEWSEPAPLPIRQAAAAAEVLPLRQVSYQVIEPAPIRKPILEVAPVVKEAMPSRKTIQASAVSTPPPVSDRCADKLGVAWIVCREQARLEYCEGRQADEATCPSAIPYSPPS